MNSLRARSKNPKRFFSLTAILMTAALGGCQSSGSKDDGLVQVDELLARIERVYVECELSRDRVFDSFDALQLLVAPGSAADPIESHAKLLAAIDASEIQSAVLVEQVEPMKKLATTFFEQWETDLEAFSRPSMREHSQLRLDRTRALYTRLVESVEPALTFNENFNLFVRDHALFLGNDLSPSAMALIASETDALDQLVTDIDVQVARSLQAAQEYVRDTASDGPDELSAKVPEGEPVPEVAIEPAG